MRRQLMRAATTLPLALMLIARPAVAQDESAEEGTEAAEAAAPEAEPTGPSDESRGKAAFPRISDDDETIYAVQRKAYLVDQKIELTPMLTASFTDRFVQTLGGAASATYHIAENFGVELSGAFMFPDESGLTTEILKEGKLTPEIAKLTQMLWGVGLSAQWSPIYGKIEIFDVSLGNFAFYVSAGLAVGQTRVQCTPATTLDEEVHGAGAKCNMITATGTEEDAFQVVYEPSRTQLMGALAGGVRFYFSSVIGLKIEVKDWIFPARVYRPDSSEPTQRFTDAIRNNVFVQLGVSFLFGGEEN